MDRSVQIAVVGAGALGHSAAWAIVSSWPEETPLALSIFDHDRIELSNLNRQVLFQESDLGDQKGPRLKERLDGLTSAAKKAQLSAVSERINARNCDRLLGAASVVIDATDSPPTKFLLNDYCLTHDIAFCYAGVAGKQGQLLMIPGRANCEGQAGCVRCLFGDLSQTELAAQKDTCQQNGVLGPVAGYIGFLAANAVLNYLLSPKDEYSTSRLVRFSTKDFQTKTTSVPVAADCPLHKPSAEVDHRLDLKSVRCPQTFLYSKLAFEKTSAGETLEIRFDTHESADNVETSIVDEGAQVIRPANLRPDGRWQLTIRRPG